MAVDRCAAGSGEADDGLVAGLATEAARDVRAELLAPSGIAGGAAAQIVVAVKTQERARATPR